MNIAPMLGPTTGQAEQAVQAITEPADAVNLLAAVPEGVSFVNMNKSAHDLASRLHNATEDLTITANMSGNEEDYYWHAAIRYVHPEPFLEDVPRDGWSVDAADDTKEIFAVFGLNSSDSRLARECLVSFMVAQKKRSAKRQRHTSGAFPNTDCKFPLDFALRTGDMVVYEPSHLSGAHATRQLVRGMILSFLVYTPAIGEEEIMTEFNKQTVVFAYVYTSVLKNNYLVVRVRLNRLPMPHNSPDHSPTPHRLCT